MRRRDSAFRAVTEPIEVDWWDDTRLTLWPDEQISAAIARTGAFEPATATAMKKLLFPSACVIDAGANSGVHTLLCARWCERVIAVEPSPRELGKLRRNIAINRFENVTVVPNALGAAPGRGQLRVSDATFAGHNTLGPTFGYRAPLETELDVDIITIDDLSAPADLIKIDVEGAEVDALRGAQLTLRTYRPALVVEVNAVTLEAFGTSVQTLDSTLSDIGYRLYDIEGGTGALRRIAALCEAVGENVVAMAR